MWATSCWVGKVEGAPEGRRGVENGEGERGESLGAYAIYAQPGNLGDLLICAFS